MAGSRQFIHDHFNQCDIRNTYKTAICTNSQNKVYDIASSHLYLKIQAVCSTLPQVTFSFTNILSAAFFLVHIDMSIIYPRKYLQDIIPFLKKGKIKFGSKKTFMNENSRHSFYCLLNT